MKSAKFAIFTAIIIFLIGFILSCSLDPYGYGLGGNSKGGDTSFLTPNPNIETDGDGNNNCTKPSVPNGVYASELSSSSIKISWNSVSDANYYNIYRTTLASGQYSYLTNTSSISYTDGNLPPSATYYYRITAQNACGESAMSNSVSAKTSAAPSAPSTSSGL